MTKFKEGDEVKIISNTYMDGSLSINQDAVGEVGVISFVQESFNYPYYVNGSSYHAGDLELVPEKTLYSLEIGDALTNESGQYWRVLEILTQTVLLSAYDEENHAGSWYTLKELEDSGFYLKSPTPEPKELTLKEVAKLAGVDEVKIVER